MTLPSSAPDPLDQSLSEDKKRLMEVLSDWLQVAMGVRPLTLPELLGGPAPLSVAFTWLLPYAALAALALWLATGGTPLRDGHAKLFGLTVWAGLYFAAAIAFARAATQDALDIVRRDIIPYATEGFARAVAKSLERSPTKNRIEALLTWVIAAAAMVAAVWVTQIDVAQLDWWAQPFPTDLLFWAATAFYLSFTATRAVRRGRFYLSFARALDEQWSDKESLHEQSGSLYVFGAADSPLVVGLSKLGSRILGFWALIFLSIVAIMTLVLLPEPYGLPRGSLLLFLLVPITGFFSLGYGSLIYLGSEGAIRNSLRRFTLAQAHPFQERASALVGRAAVPSKAKAAEIERLHELSDRIIAGGRYGSRILATVSIALPLILPVIGIIQSLYRAA